MNQSLAVSLKMSHHLVTVCMFCLLCAAHTCGSHVDVHKDVLTYDPVLKDTEHMTADLDSKRRIESRLRYNQKLQKIRQRREVKKVNPNTYVEQIFSMYGDAETTTMNMTGFNKMLEDLDLHNLVQGGVKKTERKVYIYGDEPKEEVVNVSINSVSFQT